MTTAHALANAYEAAQDAYLEHAMLCSDQDDSRGGSPASRLATERRATEKALRAHPAAVAFYVMRRRARNLERNKAWLDARNRGESDWPLLSSDDGRGRVGVRTLFRVLRRSEPREEPLR